MLAKIRRFFAERDVLEKLADEGSASEPLGLFMGQQSGQVRLERRRLRKYR